MSKPKKRKCGFCRKPFEKLAQCYIFKTFMRTYGRPLSYFKRFPEFCKEMDIQPERKIEEICGTSTVYLCDECKRKDYVRAGETYKPFVLEDNYFRAERNPNDPTTWVNFEFTEEEMNEL